MHAECIDLCMFQHFGWHFVCLHHLCFVQPCMAKSVSMSLQFLLACPEDGTCISSHVLVRFSECCGRRASCSLNAVRVLVVDEEDSTRPATGCAVVCSCLCTALVAWCVGASERSTCLQWFLLSVSSTVHLQCGTEFIFPHEVACLVKLGVQARLACECCDGEVLKHLHCYEAVQERTTC